MAQITVSIGSNIERERHVRICLDALAETFGPLVISRVFESEPVGFEDGRNFYNLVVAFDSDRPVGELQAWCKRLEFANGRREGVPKFSPRTLDIDLLTVGDLTGRHDDVELPRGEILHHAFVLKPLAELLPEARHPLTARTYRAHWDAFETGQQRLWPVEFVWQGRGISAPD
ncbi:2-amino-4-hydroxy-6-hydroxymethyldihydropteridine diphosphokinase [Halomonas rhizosphaerae]|uniref:2-amino-4-hydroxy-6-hydroxymethyldihydropteridine diphosphokinase n=1 Tax=Halomonas rhizosphaerae TaxID=3043296 RepID=A0ABT6V424_9GAMM|nr:2-amino-4-hydroxy-6-hydroxymethyldihydropteridine diphosphokinase [Halomonas rhizosphaerae]MDI5892977.1 2-amino-4-hydroxy-6-hydroxymethyldihydropteridine diphosphokinase [Halomonas rhizosphaerae]